MKAKALKAATDKLQKQSDDLRKLQASFQQELFMAQNKAMKDFMDDVHQAVEKIAAKKHLDLVLPSNAALYANDKLDLTEQVLDSIK